MDEILLLGAVVLIRTILEYFLPRETQEFSLDAATWDVRGNPASDPCFDTGIQYATRKKNRVPGQNYPKMAFRGREPA
jgi:hypothetical protein